jgi:NAD-dependent dihydropyrimidine dehydrogenase PreA subunit
MFNSYVENTLSYDPTICNGCGKCVEVCPHAVFEMNGRKAVMARPTSCMECGACQINCIMNSIQVESGVGCASAMIRAALLGKKEAECSCS